MGSFCSSMTRHPSVPVYPRNLLSTSHGICVIHGDSAGVFCR
jgi:hypothetical protein